MNKNSTREYLPLLDENSSIDDIKIVLNKVIVFWNETNEILYPNPIPKELRDE